MVMTDQTQTEEVEPVVPDKKKPAPKPRSKEETRARRLSTAQASRDALALKIEQTRDLVRTTRLAPGERQAQRDVIGNALADLRELDRRIHWLTNGDGPEVEEPDQIDQLNQ